MKPKYSNEKKETINENQSNLLVCEICLLGLIPQTFD